MHKIWKGRIYSILYCHGVWFGLVFQEPVTNVGLIFELHVYTFIPAASELGYTVYAEYLASQIFGDKEKIAFYFGIMVVLY